MTKKSKGQNGEQLSQRLRDEIDKIDGKLKDLKATENAPPDTKKYPITDALDILSFVRGYLNCIEMAAGSLSSPMDSHAISSVAYIASDKIDEAVALLRGRHSDRDTGRSVPSDNE